MKYALFGSLVAGGMWAVSAAFLGLAVYLHYFTHLQDGRNVYLLVLGALFFCGLAVAQTVEVEEAFRKAERCEDDDDEA